MSAPSFPAGFIRYCGSRVDPRQPYAGRQPWRIRDVGDAAAADIVPGNHKDRRGGIRQPLLLLGERDHLHVHQLFDAELGPVFMSRKVNIASVAVTLTWPGR